MSTSRNLCSPDSRSSLTHHSALKIWQNSAYWRDSLHKWTVCLVVSLEFVNLAKCRHPAQAGSHAMTLRRGAPAAPCSLLGCSCPQSGHPFGPWPIPCSLDKRLSYLGKGSIEKKTFTFTLTPPPPCPQFGQLGPFFWEVKTQDLKVSLELKILW